jgi:leucine efflux protein
VRRTDFGLRKLIVLIGNAVAQRLRAIPSARKIATRLAGLTLVGFGIKLATNNR